MKSKTKIRWETLKRRAITALGLDHGVHPGRLIQEQGWLALLEAIDSNRSAQDVLDEWTREARAIVNNWDIRMARKLIEVSALDFPKGPIRAEYNKGGDWVIIFE